MIEPEDSLLDLLCTAIVGLVRREQPDLSTRQLAVFLTCYLQDDTHTVRGLAARLGIPKASVTRALDRLQKSDLTRRRTDERDRRSVLVARTIKGAAFLQSLQKDIVTNA